MKQLFIAIVVLMFAAPAFAAETWLAYGVQSMQRSGSSNVAWTEFGRGGFESEALCDTFITNNKALPAGSGVVRNVIADCYLVRTEAALQE
jgi:hypothetical protein